jgi:hypothetical protein
MKVYELSEELKTKLLLQSYKAQGFCWPNTAYNDIANTIGTLTEHKASLWFFSNAFVALKKGYTGMSIKLSASYWTANECNIGIRGIRKVLQFLLENEYIELYIGSKDTRSKEAYPSYVVFKPKLVQLFAVNKDFFVLNKQLEPDTPLIQLKTRYKGSNLTFGYTPRLMDKARLVGGYNQSLSNLLLTLEGVTIPGLEYCRSFLDDFNQGGRYYIKGSGFQSLGQKARLNLKMQGESVVELDYAAMHPNILLELKSKESLCDVVGLDFDPYQTALHAKSTYLGEIHKHKLNLEDYDPVRNLNKFAMMLMLNCKDKQSAVQALYSELRKDQARPEEEQKYVGVHDVKAKNVFSALLETNHKIEEYFFSDVGVYLQNIDSEIASLVIKDFVDSNEPVLCWHDSFVVRKSKEAMLQSSMLNAWKEYFKASRFCRVSKK